MLPLWLVRREGRPPAGALTFFAAIGVGFLVLEVALIQRFVLFLGFPTYALSVVLFSLLLFTGLGAYLSTRAGADPRRRLIVALSAAVVLIAAAAVGLQPLLRELIDLPFALRVAATVAMLAPAGVLLGMAMPIGLQRIEALHPGAVDLGLGDQRDRLGGRGRAGGRGRDRVGLRRGHTRGGGLLRRGAGARLARALARDNLARQPR